MLLEKGYFCVVLGPDGSGKTTLLKNIKNIKSNWVFTSADPRDLYPIEGLEYQNWALEVHPREYVKNMLPLTRSMFYMTTLAIEYEYYIWPAINSKSIVICDSYWYRFLAKEILLNPHGVSLFQLLPNFLPVPDLIIWLDISLDTAFSRKELSIYEYYVEKSFKGYKSFQEDILDKVKEMVNGIPIYNIDGNLPQEKLALEVINQISRALNLGCVSK